MKGSRSWQNTGLRVFFSYWFSKTFTAWCILQAYVQKRLNLQQMICRSFKQKYLIYKLIHLMVWGFFKFCKQGLVYLFSFLTCFHFFNWIEQAGSNFSSFHLSFYRHNVCILCCLCPCMCSYYSVRVFNYCYFSRL